MTMNSELWSAVIGLILLAAYILYFLRYRETMIKSQTQAKEIQKETAVSKTLDKFFVGKKKQETRKKFEEMEKLKKQMEDSISMVTSKRQQKAEDQLKSFKDESTMIEEGDMKYFSFAQGLKSAMPTTEEERKKDMTDLMATVKQLEMLDADHYGLDEEEEEAAAGGMGGLGGLGGMGGLGMGKAMFYDDVSQKLIKIIDDHDFSDQKFV